MSGLPRELIRWIQSLDLTWSVRNPKWDLSNGYLVAEIFSWYFPRDIEMHMYHNATALDQKLCNWRLLKKVMKKQDIDISDDVINATMHCKEGAAKVLIQMLYENLTNRQLRLVSEDADVNFSDHAYQSQLPLHARSTAINSIRNNFRISEQMVSHDILINQQKVQVILDRHIENRAKERMEDPERFDHRKTLGELAPRRLPLPEEEIFFQDDDVEMDDAGSGRHSASVQGRNAPYFNCDTEIRNSSSTSLSRKNNPGSKCCLNESGASRHSSGNCFQEIQVKQSSLAEYNNSARNEANQPACY